MIRMTRDTRYALARFMRTIAEVGAAEGMRDRRVSREAEVDDDGEPKRVAARIVVRPHFITPSENAQAGAQMLRALKKGETTGGWKWGVIG